MLVPLGTRLGSGAAFFLGGGLPFDLVASALESRDEVCAVELDSDSIESRVRFRDVGVGGVIIMGATGRRGAGFGRINAGKGAGNGLVVMNMVAAKRSGFDDVPDAVFR